MIKIYYMIMKCFHIKREQRSMNMCEFSQLTFFFSSSWGSAHIQGGSFHTSLLKIIINPSQAWPQDNLKTYSLKLCSRWFCVLDRQNDNLNTPSHLFFWEWERLLISLLVEMRWMHKEISVKNNHIPLLWRIHFMTKTL